MARYGPSGYEPGFGDMTVGDYANGMPNIRLGEMLKSFLRQLIWLIPLLLLGIIPAVYFTKDIKRTYEGTGSILVQAGSEYIYESVTSAQSQGVLMTPDTITLNEVAIMKNNTVVEQVMGEMVDLFGKERFAEDAFEKIDRAEESNDPVAYNNARVELFKTIETNFWVTPQPKTGIINLGYKHEDGEIAVETLNAFIRAYRDYRQSIFVEGAADVFAKRRIATEEQLAEVDANLNNFLRRNDISDFDSERAGAGERTEALRAELNTNSALMAETEAALAAVEAQLRNTEPQINLYVDDRGSQRVAQAELELKQLLAKYLPGSDPVRAKQAEISELKSLQQANGGKAIGGRRVGPNPTYQELLTRRNMLQSTADSYREKEFTVQQLLSAVDGKVKKLRRLGPEYSNLLRKRETLDVRLKGYTLKEQEALVNQEQAEANSENVKVISWATLPRKGRNMKKIMMALIMIGWAFTLFMIALLRVFLDPRLYSDPTRRVRGRRASDADIHDGYGRDIPRRTEQPYVPEPVRPAAAYYQDPQVYQPQPQPQSQPQAQPYAPQAYEAPQAYAPVPYAAAGAAAYDMGGNNPYAQPSIQTEPPHTGELPSSETD